MTRAVKTVAVATAKAVVAAAKAVVNYTKNVVIPAVVKYVPIGLKKASSIIAKHADVISLTSSTIGAAACMFGAIACFAGSAISAEIGRYTAFAKSYNQYSDIRRAYIQGQAAVLTSLATGLVAGGIARPLKAGSTGEAAVNMYGVPVGFVVGNATEAYINKMCDLPGGVC